MKMKKIIFGLICFMIVGCTTFARYHPTKEIQNAVEHNQEYINLSIKGNNIVDVIRYFIGKKYRLQSAELSDDKSILCFKKN